MIFDIQCEAHPDYDGKADPGDCISCKVVQAIVQKGSAAGMEIRAGSEAIPMAN